ncbi:MAG: UDP-N-acetylmuramate dehydrogenase [Velocimicrobium sp.]
MNEFDKQLYDLLGTNKIKRNEMMSYHTTFRIGGPADYFVMPESKEEIQSVLELCKKEDMPFYILGNGSNLLVGDKGFFGVVIQIAKGMDQVCFKKDGRVQAFSGILLSKLAMEIAEQGLSGFEFASGIPGSLGGAITMNAGAYGSEIKDVIVEATIIDDVNKIRVLSKDELTLSYRKSIVQRKGYVILDAVFEFQRGDRATIMEVMNDLNRRRLEKQPLNLPSAGSMFKRPEGYFAGKLIDDAGLRGFRVGGAAISEKHCGFIVNIKDATANDVREVIYQVDRRVFEQFGVHLEPEVRMIGNF